MISNIYDTLIPLTRLGARKGKTKNSLEVSDKKKLDSLKKYEKNRPKPFDIDAKRKKKFLKSMKKRNQNKNLPSVG